MKHVFCHGVVCGVGPKAILKGEISSDAKHLKAENSIRTLTPHQRQQHLCHLPLASPAEVHTRQEEPVLGRKAITQLPVACLLRMGNTSDFLHEPHILGQGSSHMNDFRHPILGDSSQLSVREAPYPDVEVPLCVSSTDLKGIVGTRVNRGGLDLEHIGRHTPL